MRPTRVPQPVVFIAHLIDALRHPGESRLHAAERTLLEEALWTARGCQQAAAEDLGISPRVMNYKLGKRAMRPKDRKPTTPVDN